MLAAGLFFFAAGCSARETGPSERSPRRIISLAPSTTEIVYALGVGDRLVGVTRYCDHPPAATNITKVGGYLDPSYETLIALRPDLTILLDVHEAVKAQLEKARLPTLLVPNRTVGDVHDAIRLIGEACGARTRADALLTDLNERTLAVSRAVLGRDRPRVLLCIGRDIGAGRLTGAYVAGSGGFHDQILRLAGGSNAHTGRFVAYPRLSAEGILRLDPDIIIDLLGEMRPGGETVVEVMRQWRTLEGLGAVRNGRIHLIVGDQALRPGPRYILCLEAMARLLHPGQLSGDRSHGR